MKNKSNLKWVVGGLVLVAIVVGALQLFDGSKSSIKDRNTHTVIDAS